MSLIAESIARIGVGANSRLTSYLGLWNDQGRDGRSGYWRLFFTQLQEEFGKEQVKEKAPVKTLKDYGITVVSEKDTLAKKQKRKNAKLVGTVPLPTTPQTRLPAQKYRPAAPVQAHAPAFLATVWQITLEIRAMVGNTQTNVLKFAQQEFAKHKQLQEELEQDDEDLLLLLA